MGKLLIIVGIVFILAGLWILYLPRIPFLGKLPGDIAIQRESFRFYMPITSAILVSLLLSLIFYIINRYKN